MILNIYRKNGTLFRPLYRPSALICYYFLLIPYEDCVYSDKTDQTDKTGHTGELKPGLKGLKRINASE